ncbi:MAG: cardiolipin synthase [Prevotella sp.]|nr:cardiolipin synthase [Prevotella sp.]
MHALNLILAIIYYIIVVLTVIHVVMDNRQPAKTMAWALVIWFVPVVGIILYLFFGLNTRKERLVNQRQLDELSKRSMLGFVEQQNLQLPEEHKPVIDLFTGQSLSLPFQTDEVEVYTDGYQFFPALLKSIASARSHIHIDVYIIEEDPLGRLVADALIAKSREGVEVRLIYDDVGCWKVRHRFFERMREEGIEAVPFLPVRFPSFTSKVNYRNHRKMIVVDGQTGFIGGMNIALRYVSDDWRDTMVRVTGPGVYALQRAFLIDWYFVDRSLLNDRKYYPNVNPSSTTHHPSPFTLHPSPRPLLQVVTSSPVVPYPEILQGYVRIIMAAHQYVFIETPYFLPNEPMLFALKTVAVAGVDVRILVPEKNDSRFVDWACRSYLREAVEAGVKVSLYKGGFLHSKLMVCDDSISTCGSTNVDFRSFENNFEANAFFYGEQTALRMKQVFLADEERSVQLASLSSRMKPKFMVRLFESLVRMLAPLM